MDSISDVDETQSLAHKARFKDLLEKGVDIEKEIGHQDFKKSLVEISNLISVSDDINAEGSVTDRSEHTTEVVLDVQVLRMNYGLMSLALGANSYFSEEEYVNALSSTIYKTFEPNWKSISESAIRNVKCFCGSSSLLGAVNLESTNEDTQETNEKRQRLKRKKSVLEKEEKPENVEKIVRSDKGAEKVNVIHEQVAHIFNCNHRQPIKFYKLVLDPKSFMRSIENIFQISFLVREGLIGIHKDESDEPVVRLIDSKTRNKTQNEGLQAISSISIDFYQKMIKHYNIKEAMLDSERRLVRESESDSD